MGEERMSVVRAWPKTFALDIDGLGAVRFCHAVPRSDEELVTPLTPESDFVAALAGTVEDVVAGGHLHIQFDRVLGDHRFINVGSVGWPYEGRPGAYWALLGPDVRLMRSDYDVEAAADAICASGHPGAAERLHELLDPPGPAEMARRFEELRAA
jgi:hypothetical protein